MYEDDLPETITDQQYDLWYAQSWVVDDAGNIIDHKDDE